MTENIRIFANKSARPEKVARIGEFMRQNGLSDDSFVWLDETPDTANLFNDTTTAIMVGGDGSVLYATNTINNLNKNNQIKLLIEKAGTGNVVHHFLEKTGSEVKI